MQKAKLTAIKITKKKHEGHRGNKDKWYVYGKGKVKFKNETFEIGFEARIVYKVYEDYIDSTVVEIQDWTTGYEGDAFIEDNFDKIMETIRDELEEEIAYNVVPTFRPDLNKKLVPKVDLDLDAEWRHKIIASMF